METTSMYCPCCGIEYSSPTNIDVIRDWGKCLACDHVEGEILLDQDVELILTD